MNKKIIWEKIKKVAFEVFVIVFSITLSIWLSNLNEKRQQTNEGKEFLKDLKSDLAKDLQITTKEIEIFEVFKKRIDTMLDSKLNQHKKRFNLSNVNLFRNNTMFESYKNSAKLGYIENHKLRKDILYYYEQDYELLTLLNQKYNNLFEDIDYQIARESTFQKALQNKEIQTKITNLGYSTDAIVNEGKSTKMRLEKLILDIDKQ